MSDCMMFPKDLEKFIEDYSFEDKEEVYTNGSMLIPVFRVEQMIEHYFGRGWIPVTERLPKPFEVVYVYDHTKQRVTDAYMTRHNEWVGVCMNSVVTHWIPLPEPPKEEEK